MLVEEVDAVGPQPLQRALHRRANTLRPAVALDADLLAAGEDETELGRDDHLVAAAGEGSSEQVLVGERAVGLGGIEEGTAELDGPVVLVGSSMGGWLMLLCGLELGTRLAGLVGIAAAPDFTDWGYDAAQKARLQAGETVLEDNAYGYDPTPTHPLF